jgi:hypothetical protein
MYVCMYVCMYACVYACNTCMHIYACRVYACNTCLPINVFIFTCTQHILEIQRRKKAQANEVGGNDDRNGGKSTDMDEDEESSAACEECGSTGDSENMLLCDGYVCVLYIHVCVILNACVHACGMAWLYAYMHVCLYVCM